MTTELSERELAMLAMEHLWWEYSGVKETRIREQFDVTAFRYYQELNALIDREEALAHDPLLVRRLRRRRDQNQRSRRTAGRNGLG